MTTRRKMTPEGYVKNAVMEYLAVKHVFYIRVNSGAQVIHDVASGKRRFIQMAPAGTADFLALPKINVTGWPFFIPLWIETKAKKEELTPKQEIFRQERIADGHHYIVAWSIDDVENWFKQHNL